LIDFYLDEKADVSYYDNLYGNRWARLCRDCSEYSRKRSFKEGMNNITFKAVDSIGNEVNKNVNFIVDSQSPRIHKTEPRSGYASGLFEVQYSEDNPLRVEIFYGNEETGYRNQELESCTSGTRVLCSIDVDLSDYNNEKIEYYFEIEDIAGNVKKSQMKKNLPVDTVFPVLNNPTSFWSQGAGRYSRYIYFTFNVTEENLDKITYSYLDSRNKTREKILCSRLRDNICEIKKSFARGNWSIDIQITDKAGNAIGDNAEFEVNY